MVLNPRRLVDRLAEAFGWSRSAAVDARRALLGEAGRLLAGSPDYEATLGSVARLAIPSLADWCAVDLVKRDGEIRRVAIAHADPERVRMAVDLRRRYPLNPDAPYGAAWVLRTDRSALYPEISDTMLVAAARDAEHLSRLRAAGLTSGMCVPLVARGRTLGTISFGSTTRDRRYGERDLAFAEELARLAALAMDNAQLFEDVRAGEARVRAILETALDAIVVMDHKGRILEFNTAAETTFGYRRQEVLGREMAELIVPPSLREAHRRGLARYLATGQGVAMDRRLEMTAMRADGSEFPVELAITRVRVDGPPIFTGYVRDIAERKRAEAVQRQAEALQAVAALAVAAAHEINNPLSIIFGKLELISRRLSEGAEARAHIESAAQAARRIRDIVERMNRITRVEISQKHTNLPAMLDLWRSSANDPRA